MKKLKLTNLFILIGLFSFAQTIYSVAKDTTYLDGEYTIETRTSFFDKFSKLLFSEVKYEVYYSNGNIQEKYYFCAGLKVGNYFEFYEDGNLKCVGYYKNVNEIDFNNIEAKCDTVIYEKPGDKYEVYETIVCSVVSIKKGKWEYYDYINNKVRFVWYEENEIVKEYEEDLKEDEED
jgi:antitoxin component YwqK of YwqJK toxin-antitoxin module